MNTDTVIGIIGVGLAVAGFFFAKKIKSQTQHTGAGSSSVQSGRDTNIGGEPKSKS